MFTNFLISKASGYLAVAMLGFVVVLTLALWFTNHRLENAQNKLGTLRAEVTQAQAETASVRKAAQKTNQSNLATIAECQAVNAQNAAQRIEVDDRAKAAIARSREYETQLASQEAKYEALSTQLRTIDGPLSDDLVGWLCSPAANCADRNRNGDAGERGDRAGAAGTDETRTGTTVTTRRLANVYRQTVGSLMLCNDRLLKISELVQ